MNRLLFPSDFSDISKNALTYCSRFAEIISADITLFHSYEARKNLRRLIIPGAQKRAIWQKMSEFTKDPTLKIPPSISWMARKGKIADQIGKATQDGQFRYVVMGKKHSYIAFRKMLGSKTSQVIARAKAPVLVVPAGAQFKGFQNILVVGGEYRNLDRVIQQNILSLSLKFGANLHYIDVSEAPDTWGFNQELLTKNTFLFQKKIPESFAVESLVEYMIDQNIDLMVMPTQKQQLFEDLFSYSYKNNCLEKTDVPLLVFHSNYLEWAKKGKNEILERTVETLPSS